MPFICGDFVEEDDEHWECFRLLWIICDIACAFEVYPGDARRLQWIVQLYLEYFTTLYPDVTVTPKMHYLLHLPKQMEQYVFFFNLHY